MKSERARGRLPPGSRSPEFEFLAESVCLPDRTLRLSPGWPDALGRELPSQQAICETNSGIARPIPECKTYFE
jgi:hypothetical protein